MGRSIRASAIPLLALGKAGTNRVQGISPPAAGSTRTTHSLHHARMNRRDHLLASWHAACGLAAWTLTSSSLAAPSLTATPAAGQGRVLLLRHAKAPGTFDPPGFQLGDCRTQRNLDAEGRAQARRLGDWCRQRGLVMASVRSSPWCRCLETAELAFGRAAPWADLGSPVNLSPAQRARQLAVLRQELAAVTAQGGLHVWVTHMFVQDALTGHSTASGEGLLIQHTAVDQVAVLETWTFD